MCRAERQRCPTSFMNILVALPHVREGTMKALAVSGSARASAAPNVLTVAEQGYPDFNAVAWFGILSPAGTPNEIVRKVHSDVAKVFRSRVQKQGNAIRTRARRAQHAGDICGIHQAGNPAHRRDRESLRDQTRSIGFQETARPIMPSAGDQPDAHGITAGHQTIAGGQESEVTALRFRSGAHPLRCATVSVVVSRCGLPFSSFFGGPHGD